MPEYDAFGRPVVGRTPGQGSAPRGLPGVPGSAPQGESFLEPGGAAGLGGDDEGGPGRSPLQALVRLVRCGAGTFVVLVVLLAVVGALVGGDDDEGSGSGGDGDAVRLDEGADTELRPIRDPARGAAIRVRGDRLTLRGRRGAGTLAVTLPARLETGEPFGATAEGSYGDPDELGDGGGVILSVTFLRSPSCPQVYPSSDGQLTVSRVLGMNVFGSGPYRAAAQDNAPFEAGTYALCGYLYGPGDDTPSLLVGHRYVVRERPADAPRRAYRQEEMRPGVYAAGPRDIAGGTAGTQLEFEVVRASSSKARNQMRNLAAKGLPVTACRSGSPPDATGSLLLARTDYGDVYDTFSNHFDGRVDLFGGAATDDEARGQLSYAADGSRCQGSIAFTAKRVAGGAHPLRDELRR